MTTSLIALHQIYLLVYCRHAAEYIERRDGGIKSNWEDIVLCAGASEGIRVNTLHGIDELIQLHYTAFKIINGMII